MTSFRHAAAALAIGCLPLIAHANALENMVEVCADPGRPPAEALRFCLNALERRDMARQPDEVRAKVMMNAGIAALQLGRYDQAVESHSEALRVDPTLAPAYLGRAQARSRLGRAGEAMADYGAAVRYAPNSADAYLGRGAARLRAGNVAGALTDFDRAVGLRPSDTVARFNRGTAHLTAGDFARAEADFSAVLEREPDDAEALLNRGRARAALGRPGAGEDFEDALDLRPEWGAGWFARGQFHEFIGRQEAANADYMRAYQLGHSDPRLLERMRQFGGG